MLKVNDIADYQDCELHLDLSDLRVRAAQHEIAENLRHSGYAFGFDVAELLETGDLLPNQTAALTMLLIYFADQQHHAKVIETLLDDCFEGLRELEAHEEWLQEKYDRVIKYHKESLTRDEMMLKAFVRKLVKE
jgi:hypothetical protein